VARRVEAWRAARGFAPSTRSGDVGGSGSSGGAGARQLQQQQPPQRAERSVVAAAAVGPVAAAAAAPAAAAIGSAAVGTAAAGVGSVTGQQPAAAEGNTPATEGQPAAVGSSKVQVVPNNSCSRMGSLMPPRGRKGFQQQQQQQQQPRQHHQQQRHHHQQQSVMDHQWCRVTGTANVYCSEATGEAHICDQSCTEHVLERSSGLLVCPISGTIRDDLGAVVQEAEGDEDEEGGGGVEGDFGGRLARAFEMGYYAESEKELERTCFVPRRR